MGKIILTVLMVVMLATPCLAQEIKTNNLLSIENTFWSVFPPDGNFLGFADGSSYHCHTVTPVVLNYLGQNYICKESSYDYVDPSPVSTFNIYGFFHKYFYGDLQPLLGIGIFHEMKVDSKTSEIYHLESGLLLKIDNNWKPDNDPIVCGGIADIQCPRNMRCKDDPSDYCRWGVNLHCSGFCVYDFQTPPEPEIE